ncbi:MAG: zinc metallopeptidase [Pirellulaceae bacterium]|nr:zinc metallopeptidase [Pirellulaceae bacterium]
MYFFDFNLLLWVAPALLLAFVAQWMVRSAYSTASQVGARTSGFRAAREILDSAGLYDVGIEQVPGQLSDHYDPRAKVLRLSGDVYHGRSLAAVGIAAHEAGHALQDATGYMPLVVRNFAVPAASLGSSAGILLLALGLVFRPLLIVGIVLFAGVVFFQLVNLPVEFNASSRAKGELLRLGIVDGGELPYVRRVLNAAALTYVAATLQSVLTLLYYLSRAAGDRR